MDSYLCNWKFEDGWECAMPLCRIHQMFLAIVSKGPYQHAVSGKIRARSSAKIS